MRFAFATGDISRGKERALKAANGLLWLLSFYAYATRTLPDENGNKVPKPRKAKRK